jgi:hypothetical protein
VAVYHIFTVSYGRYNEIVYATTQTVASHDSYADEHLSVIYERKIDECSDFLHLKVDTTYRQIGKGAFRYELLCDRSFSLRSFDGEYHNISNVAEACFVDMDDRDWNNTGARRRITGYDCQRATALINNKAYEAWYTEALPHRHPKSKVSDTYRGLVLEMRNAEGSYSLRAKYIGQQIG